MYTEFNTDKKFDLFEYSGLVWPSLLKLALIYPDFISLTRVSNIPFWSGLLSKHTHFGKALKVTLRSGFH